MIKLVLFDLDGVLIDAKKLHYDALNQVLGEYAITEDEHMNVYDGLKTIQKLQMLTERKGLPADQHQALNEAKQNITIKLIADLKPIPEIIETFKEIQELGYKIGVCSNSVRRTVLTALAKTNLMEYCSVIISK